MKRVREVGSKCAFAVFVGAVGLAWSAGPSAAQIVPINELRTLQPNAIVEIGVVAHSIVVQGWDRNEVQITGEYDSQFDVIEISGNGQSFSFEIDQESDRRSRERSSNAFRLDVRLPRGVRLSVGTVSGSLDVSGLSGEVEATAVSGDVDATGNLELASFESVSGFVSYVGDSPTVNLESVSGGVEYMGSANEVDLESVSGSVRMEGEAEIIEASSVSGSVRIVSARPVLGLDAESVSGGVAFVGRLVPGGTIDVESHSGSIELALGSDTNARFELTSWSGSLSATLPGIRNEERRRSRGSRNQYLTFVVGSGTGEVTATSFSGSVRVTEGRQ